MFKLRYYQKEAIDAVYKYFENNCGNPVIASPTGTGKSLVIAGFLHKVYTDFPDQRLIMLTHVKELIEQNFEKLIALWPTAPAGIFSAGLRKRNSSCPITFAGIQSVAKKADLFGHIDLIVIDECHLVSDKNQTSYRKFIDALLKVNPNLKVIGLSATPYRLGLGPLTEGGLFTDVCYDNTKLEEFNRLIDEGFLSPLIPKRTSKQLDVTGVKKRGGEFIPKDLQEAVDDTEVTYEALKEAIEAGADRKHWLIFGTGIDHCEHIVDTLDSLGISAASTHSLKSNSLNTETIDSFKKGEIRALVNNDKLTTGFDFPEIDMLVILRPSGSAGLWVQILGRGTRPVYAEGFDLSTTEGRLQAIKEGPKQNCLVLDFAGNTPRLGPINDPLIPNIKKKKSGLQQAPIRLCPKCGCYVHCSKKICPDCGFDFPVEQKLFAEAGMEELIARAEAEKPVLTEFKVDKVIYVKHLKKDRPDTIKVTYHCGLRMFTEYICIEHKGFPRTSAVNWWRTRTTYPCPETTVEALDLVDMLTVPVRITVWVNKKYPEITNYFFEGL